MASLLISPFKRERPAAASKRPPLLPWEEELRAHRVPVIVPPQTPAAEREDPAQDDLGTRVPRDAIFPSRTIDIDGVYETQVRVCFGGDCVGRAGWIVGWIGLAGAARGGLWRGAASCTVYMHGPPPRPATKLTNHIINPQPPT